MEFSGISGPEFPGYLELLFFGLTVHVSDGSIPSPSHFFPGAVNEKWMNGRNQPAKCCSAHLQVLGVYVSTYTHKNTQICIAGGI